MLIAGITLLIGLLFGDGDMQVFLVEELPKEIKHNISDKEKQKEILAVLKAYEKEFKKLRKILTNQKMSLKSLTLTEVVQKKTIMDEFNK